MKKLITKVTLKTLAIEENKNSIVQSVVVYIKQLDGLDIEDTKLNDIKTALMEAVDNVITTAYPNKPGKISICLSIYDNNVLEIIVQDWGCGIENIDEATSPLFSTKENGTGVGFIVMMTFCDKLTVKSTPGKGTVVTMKFKTL